MSRTESQKVRDVTLSEMTQVPEPTQIQNDIIDEVMRIRHPAKLSHRAQLPQDEIGPHQEAQKRPKSGSPWKNLQMGKASKGRLCILGGGTRLAHSPVDEEPRENKDASP